MSTAAQGVARDIESLHVAAASGPGMKFMEVCGTHTMSAFRCGLHGMLPSNVRLLSGPGCPVCVTAQGDIDQIIELATSQDVAVCTYGDMLRVPGRRGSLEQARARGADVRVVYSAIDALKWAAAEPTRQFVFAAVGFETTAPATAAVVRNAARSDIQNFSVLVSHKRVLPALIALLEGGQIELDGLLCPGHVSVIIGSECYRPLVEQYGLPCVIAGFEERLITSALAVLAQQVRNGRATLVNQYPEAVTPNGNRVARELLDKVFESVDVRWRGLGEIANSGLALRSEYRAWDASVRFGLGAAEDREPQKCLCGKVITGQATPLDCELFGAPCTPICPVGPCMVSSEGTCQAWFKYHQQPSSVRTFPKSQPTLELRQTRS